VDYLIKGPFRFYFQFMDLAVYGQPNYSLGLRQRFGSMLGYDMRLELLEGEKANATVWA
jgi:hypothetical protein